MSKKNESGSNQQLKEHTAIQNEEDCDEAELDFHGVNEKAR